MRISDWSSDVCSSDLHGVTVVYADRFTPEAGKERASREGGDPKAVPFLKRFTVFNVAQCEGLRARLASDPAPLPERAIVPVAAEVIAASGVDFRIGGTRAFYVPSLDFVAVPPPPAFFALGLGRSHFCTPVT